uniref:B2 protein n=1 Tax=Noccaea caerulescens TaxID=107243 RepID=A0A1J3GZ95_NOCCA
MENMRSFWQLGDELRGQSKASEDQKWFMAASKLADQTRSKGERSNNLDLSKGSVEIRPREKFGFQEENKFETFNFNMLNSELMFNANVFGQKKHLSGGKYSYNQFTSRECINGSNNFSSTHINDSVEKRFKTLPASECLPKSEVLGGYIFVCNNDTMLEDLKCQLFGLPPRYRDSVRTITPGLPLFLYNYTTHQLHGIFEATTFGGSNIDPTAWEDKKCKGESRFPAQVRIRVRKLYKALEEDAFRPVLHHYDGPKFRLELTIPETLALLDLCEQAGSP